MSAAARRRSVAVILGAALLSAGACTDFTAPNGVLTAEETRELALQMGAHMAPDGFSAPLASAASGVAASVAGDPAPFSVSIDVSVPCPRGGTTRVRATVTGTIDEATESLVADLTGTQRPEDCGFNVHGKTLRVTGSLTASAHAEIENGEPVGVHRASLEGQFTWRASDGRRGTCSVNYTATANYTTNVATVDGNFCGSTIQITGPLTS